MGFPVIFPWNQSIDWWIIWYFDSPPVIKHGLLKDGPLIHDFTIKTSIYRGFPIAIFDYQRVYLHDWTGDWTGRSLKSMHGWHDMTRPPNATRLDVKFDLIFWSDKSQLSIRQNMKHGETHDLTADPSAVPFWLIETQSGRWLEMGCPLNDPHLRPTEWFGPSVCFAYFGSFVWARWAGRTTGGSTKMGPHYWRERSDSDSMII